MYETQQLCRRRDENSRAKRKMNNRAFRFFSCCKTAKQAVIVLVIVTLGFRKSSSTVGGNLDSNLQPLGQREKGLVLKDFGGKGRRIFLDGKGS